jgi:hypothetical protein
MKIAMLLALLPLPALADPLLDLATAESRAECVAMGGTLQIPDGAVTLLDLTGDGVEDAVVSEDGAFCGPDKGYLGGTGGFMIHTVVAGKVQSWQAGSWLLKDISFTAEGEAQDSFKLLLLGQHGSYCNTFGAAPCVAALTWDGERFVSISDGLVQPPAE